MNQTFAVKLLFLGRLYVLDGLEEYENKLANLLNRESQKKLLRNNNWKYAKR